MKLSKERVHHMAQSVVSHLESKGQLEIVGSKAQVVEALSGAITNELSVEDQLNAEVRALMKQHDTDITRGGVDYQKMFNMIKSKLVRERGLIL